MSPGENTPGEARRTGAPAWAVLEAPDVAPSWIERQKVLVVCSAVILLFGLTDRMVLGRFDLRAVGVRLGWAGLTLWLAWALPRVTHRVREQLFVGLAVLSSLFFGASTLLTGGAQSPLFHWILAMPLVMAVVLQGVPVAIASSTVAMVASGLFILYRSEATPFYSVQWAIQASGMGALAVYASTVYRRLADREMKAEVARSAALARAEDFQEQVEARDEFLSVASHELRTPLTSLSLSVEVLRDALAPNPLEMMTPAQLTTRVDFVHRQVRRLNRLVEELLDVSRIQGHALVLRPTSVDAVRITREVVAQLRFDAERSGSTLSLAAPERCIGNWDPSRLEQLVANLITNAIKYGAGKPIDVRLVQADGVLELSVKDRGMGIPLEGQQRIFDRFVRLGSARHYGGLGLGLWIVRNVAQAMGGDVSVRSEPSQGSVFTVTLPLTAPVLAPTAVTDSVRSLPGR
jgi:signal transduction histidine kinase